MHSKFLKSCLAKSVHPPLGPNRLLRNNILLNGLLGAEGVSEQNIQYQTMP